MKKTLQLVIAAAASISLAACGASANGGATPNNVANVQQNVLQMAVGTANYAGTPALNVVTTYRQPAGAYAPGDSGTLLSTPTLTLPTTLTTNGAGTNTALYDPTSSVLYGPATTEVGGDAITPTPQNPQNRTITSFGQSGGVFGLGIEPYNAQGSGSVSYNEGNPANNGTPYQVAPYPVPLYDAAAAPGAATPDVNRFIPWGGPPAFVATGSNGVSIVGNGNYPLGSAGLSEGIDVFLVPPATGTYTLTVVIPTNQGNYTKTATATLAAVNTITTPTNPTFTPDGAGGGTFTGWALPTGATEAYVQITDFGPSFAGNGSPATQPTGCNAASETAPVYYTLEVSGPAALGPLGDALGPGGTPSLCTAAQNTAAAGAPTTGDQYTIQVIAFNYPAYESSYPNSLRNPAPVITGAAGTDDLAVSPAFCTSTDATACDPLPLIKKRLFAKSYLKRV
jgi:hypothetical protein